MRSSGVHLCHSAYSDFYGSGRRGAGLSHGNTIFSPFLFAYRYKVCARYIRFLPSNKSETRMYTGLKKADWEYFRAYMQDVTYQRPETVFNRDIQTTRRELKIRRAAIAHNETLSRVSETVYTAVSRKVVHQKRTQQCRKLLWVTGFKFLN